MKKTILAIIIIGIQLLLAETNPAIIQFAFDKMAADSIHTYSYKKIIESPEETRIMSFDPSKKIGDQWILMSINGNPPDKDALKAFYKEMSNTSDSDKGKKNISLTTDDMYDFDIVSENDGNIIFQCKTKNEKNKKMMDKVICQLEICKKDTSLKTFKMELTEPVSPVVSVKLNEFCMEMNFQKMTDTGANLIQQTKTRIQGKALVFKELNQQVTEKYYDYKLVD